MAGDKLAYWNMNLLVNDNMELNIFHACVFVFLKKDRANGAKWYSAIK